MTKKEYMIVTEIEKDGRECFQLHHDIGGGAYFLEYYCYSHNELMRYLKLNNITEYGIGH